MLYLQLLSIVFKQHFSIAHSNSHNSVNTMQSLQWHPTEWVKIITLSLRVLPTHITLNTANLPPTLQHCCCCVVASSSMSPWASPVTSGNNNNVVFWLVMFSFLVLTVWNKVYYYHYYSTTMSKYLTPQPVVCTNINMIDHEQLCTVSGPVLHRHFRGCIVSEFIEEGRTMLSDRHPTLLQLYSYHILWVISLAF